MKADQGCTDCMRVELAHIRVCQAANAPVSRAEVRADLVRIEQTGYRPAAKDRYYPADIQAAEAKIAAQRQTPEAASVGGVTTGVSRAGAALAMNDAQSIYAHH